VEDPVFFYMVARAGGFLVKSDPTPNIINFAVLLPSDFGWKKEVYLQKITACRPLVTFGQTRQEALVWRGDLGSGDLGSGSGDSGSVELGSVSGGVGSGSGDVGSGSIMTTAFPFDPFTLYNSDGRPVVGEVLVIGGELPSEGGPESTLMIQGDMDEGEACNYDRFYDLVEQMARTAAKYEQANSPTYIDKLATTITMLRSHPEYRACRSFAEQMVADSITRVVPAGRSSECELDEYSETEVYDAVTNQTSALYTVNPSYAADCRCNETLQATQCCVPVLITKEVADVTIDAAAVGQMCAHPEDILPLLRANANQKEAGKEKKPSFDQLVNKIAAPFKTCYQLLAGLTSCKTDRNCRYGS